MSADGVVHVRPAHATFLIRAEASAPGEVGQMPRSDTSAAGEMPRQRAKLMGDRAMRSE